MKSEAQQGAELEFDSNSWQHRQGHADGHILIPCAARLGAPCQHQATDAHAPYHHEVPQPNVARLAHAHVGTAAPAFYYMQPDAYGGVAAPANRLVLAYANASMAFPVHSRHQAAQAQPDTCADGMLAAALASHVQQRVSYRQPPHVHPVSVWPPNGFHPHLFPPFSSEPTALPPYDDTVAPGIQYIEEEVVGPVPPAETGETADVIARVKAEPCTSVHDLGTGDSQGCSHTVANMPIVRLGLNARESAAVDSAGPGDSALAAPSAPPPVSTIGIETQTRQACTQTTQSASCTTTSRDQVDALAILADVALADSDEVEQLAAALEGCVPGSLAPPAGGAGRTEARKTRCLPLSALIAPVATQKEAAKAGAQPKKRKAPQVAKTARRSAATEPQKAPRTTQTVPKTAQAAAAAPPCKAAQESESRPVQKTTQLAVLNAAPRPVQLWPAVDEQRVDTLPDGAGLPPPQDGPQAAQPADSVPSLNVAQPLQPPSSASRKPVKQKTAQLASMQAREPAPPIHIPPKYRPSQNAGLGKGKGQTHTATDVPICTGQGLAAGDPMSENAHTCSSSIEQSQAHNAQNVARAEAAAAGQKKAQTSGSKQFEPASRDVARITSDKAPDQTHLPVNPPALEAALHCGKGKRKLKPPLTASAKKSHVPPSHKASAVPVDPAVPIVKSAQSKLDPVPPRADKSALTDDAEKAAPSDSTAPAQPGQGTVLSAAATSELARSYNFDHLETAKMAAKLQMQADKAALRAEAAAANAHILRTRKRRAPQSNLYPLLGGIPKRKGVYYRQRESSFEAQLDTSVFKVAHHISGGRIIYLGLYTCKPENEDSVHEALERATRTVDRTKVKLLEGCMSACDLGRHLQFPLSDYQTPEEVDMRKARTLKEFANFLKIKSDAKRPQHGKKGVAARTRRSGAVIYEARITHIPIGSFGTYATLEAAKQAFDLGAILCKGVDWQINEPLTEYMLDGAFHAHVQIPSHVIGCIQKYLNGLQEVDAEKHNKERSRILGYFRDRECPFY